MKSLILKDLYNIGHNTKSMLFMLAVLAVVLIPTSGASAYIIVSALLCSMMIMTTFTFDENSNWSRYAMIMPVSKKDVVIGKYIVLVIFCVIGSLFGLVIGLIAELAMSKNAFNLISIIELLFLTLLALTISFISGSMSIPLVFKFGAERARVLLIVSILIPLAICFGSYQVLVLLGIELTDQLVFILLCGSPIIALLWGYMMYRICCRVFEKQEL
ncbi:MAG: ABC-2 transporter permease [Lachnospiraceae bacterium]|nr:ABC-2 transporter permease [Lachnospiraceae bacterium]